MKVSDNEFLILRREAGLSFRQLHKDFTDMKEPVIRCLLLAAIADSELIGTRWSSLGNCGRLRTTLNCVTPPIEIEIELVQGIDKRGHRMKAHNGEKTIVFLTKLKRRFPTSTSK